MRTLTSIIAAAVSSAHKKSGLIFNDKLRDGRRSLKVWGWNSQQYAEAREMLERAGCYVTSSPRCSTYRLWVTEPTPNHLYSVCTYR